MSAGDPDLDSDLVLLAGLWLPGDIWRPVVGELTALGHRVHVPTLPGTDDGDTAATLDDQLSTVLTMVDALPNPMLVGHSAAATLAWLAADRRPERVSRVAMVGGFPGSSDSPYADFFPIADGTMPFPGWDPFAGPDSADLDEAAREAMAAVMVSVPENVARGVVRLVDQRRFEVPVTLVCPEFDVTEARAWIADGEVPELASVLDLSYVDIDSGHWPMVTCPVVLAHLLDDIVRQNLRPG